MKHLIINILAAFFPIVVMAGSVGTWKIYSAYGEIEQIDSVAKGDYFVLSLGNVYRVNEKDWSVTSYDRLTGMSGADVSCMAWNAVSRSLVMVYTDSNIDIMDLEGNVTNVPDLYHKTTTLDKTINGIDISGRDAYISTAFGVVRLDTKEALIRESCNLSKSVRQTSVRDGYLYAWCSDGGIMRIALSGNMADHTQWTAYSGATAGLFPGKTPDKALVERIGKMRPDGPWQTCFGDMRVVGNRLYAVLGKGWDNKAGDVPHVYDIADDKWTAFADADGRILAETKVRDYSNFLCMDVDESHPGRVLVTGRGGLYEFRDGEFAQFYGMNNSPLPSAIAGNPTYVLPTAMKVDGKGTAWMFASQSASAEGLFSLSSSGEWKSHEYDGWIYNSASLAHARSMFFDREGRLWWCNNHWWKPSLNCYDPETGQGYSYSTFLNEDFNRVEVGFVRCAAEDREGNIWIGTNVGPLMLEKEKIGPEDQVIWNQVKVPRNDGTNYADYLLAGIDITSIAVDGADRKWFGSDGNGVYVIGSDNITQEYHFTSANSCLLSDNVSAIAIDSSSGEVFIGTVKGLCSYRSDATEPVAEMNKDDVYAFPNPVTPEYHGSVTITGLSYDADVKITTANGTLVAQGRSNGGTFTWDCTDLQGRRVATGVYMVCIATSQGESGVVAKIAVVN